MKASRLLSTAKVKILAFSTCLCYAIFYNLKLTLAPQSENQKRLTLDKSFSCGPQCNGVRICLHYNMSLRVFEIHD